MGKPNVITKQYMQDNARFADVCNVYLFDGKQVVKPEELVEKDVTELSMPQGLNGVVTVEKIRDILKGCCVKTAGGVTYLVIGIENQADVHYAMVVKNMLYDSLNYSSQVEACAKEHRNKKDVSGAEFLSGFSKKDTLYPVITLTIYWNYGTWDGARSLHELFAVKDKQILEYVSDYKLNLIVPEEIRDFKKFKTELGPLLEFISCASDGERLEHALKEKKERWSVLGVEEVNLLNICLDAKLDVAQEIEKGAVGSVCKGIEELAAKRAAKAKIEGKIEGEELLNNLMHVLANQGYQLTEILSMTSEAKNREKLYKEYGIV